MWAGCALPYGGASSIVLAQYLFDDLGIDHKLPQHFSLLVRQTCDDYSGRGAPDELAQPDRQGKDFDKPNRRGIQ